MPVSINNTTLTFNDASTQTTSAVTSVSAGTGISVAGGKTPTVTNTGVTSLTGAGTVSLSGSTGAITITGTGGSGTVTSVATGNGLQGGTITTSGTLSVACPTHNTVGSYALVVFRGTATYTFGTNYAAGAGSNQIGPNTSGTWKSMSSSTITLGVGSTTSGLACRVS
jgi:hypothetical protein